MNKKVYMRLVALVFTIFWAFLPNNIFGQVVTYSLDLGLASSSTAFGNTTGYGPKVGTIGTIDWYISVGSCQPAGVWLGTNNATNHGLATLGAGTSGMEPAIAAALSINVTDPDYYCLVGINAIPNVDEVIVSATSISGTAPSDMWCLYTTNGGGSYTILGQVSALVANTNYSFTSTATLPANAEFAFVWHQTAFGTFRGAKFDFIDNSTTSTLFIEDFEDPAWATGGTNYANRTVTDNLGAWSISAVTSMTAGSDRFNGTRSARLRGNASDATNINRVEMLFDKPNGLGDLSFDYGSFSNHTGGVLETFYSIDGGVTWNSLGTIVVPAWGTSMIQQVYAGLNIPGNVRIKIEKHVQTTNSSVNIDDIVLTDFVGVPQVATPTFSPPGGNFPPGTLTVSISCATPGADIYYTTNGTNPVPGSAGTTLYTAAGISITTNTTITAIAIDPAGVLPDSNIASETYTFNFIEDFEDAAWGGAGAGNYNLRQVTDNFGQWTIAGVTQMQSDDRRIGTRSARFRGNASDNHFIQMDFDKPNGIGDISFYYGSYGAASGGILDVYYSIDGGTTWWLAGSTQPAPLWGTSMVQETFAINQPGNVRVKIEKQPQQGTTTTINIDDIELTDWFGMPTVLPLSFSPSPGTYNTQQIVNISTATPGASIYYTIGGAVPDITSTPYPAAGITVTTPTLIKAIAYEATHNHSNIAEAFFDVNLTPTIILSSTTHDFGNIEINTTSAPVTINVSGTNLTGIIGYNILGTDASAFTITPTATWNPATGEGDLEIEFKPTYLHAHNAFIRFDSVGAVDEDFYLFGTGVGTTIAAWTFPTTTGNAPKVHPAECGVLDINADIFADGTNGSDDWTDATSLVYFGGNAIPEGLCGVTTATGALSVVNIGSAYNGKSIVFKLSTLGYDDLQLTYDTRGTDTGFQTHEWYYSTDGTNFTLISTIPGRNVTTFSTQSVDFSTITALNNQSAVYIKLMVDGASGTGNNRLDNINFTALEGTYIPDPIILVSPSIIDFDEVKVGNTKAEDILVTSTNLTDPISYLLTGAGAPMFNIIESDWDPDTGGDLEVIFAPLSPGNYDAEITFSSNGAVNKIVQLVGIGVDLLPPVADFTADKTTILEGKTVQFTDISTGDPTSWEWTFTGGLPPISSDQNPIVTYNTAGIYDVELKAINDDGFSIETKLGYITVFEGKTYTLVTDMTEFEDGSQYLFVSEKNSIDYAMGWQKAGNRHAVPVVINGNIIEVAPATEVTPVQDEEFPYEITIVSENSDWLLFDALNNKYLRPRTGTDNGLVLNELKAYWSLAIDGSSAVSLICTGSEEGTTFDRNVMRFNPNGANPPLFACYASGQNDFYIYKADAATPMLSVSPTELDFGDVKIGNTSLPQTINVDGYNLLANISYNITGTGAAAFNISTTNWDPTIGGQLFITFEPIAEDDYEALLTFSSTDAVERTVTLLGSGLSLVLPVADFIADNTDIFVEESVQFTDLSTGAPISWEWTFTGGTPATSTLQNPIVEYNTIGIFDVSLTVTNEDGNHTETKTGYINVVGQEEKTYVLVTSMSEVEDGAQYLFVSEKNDIDYALGWQKAANRHGVPVVVDGNTITTTPAVIVTPTQDEVYPYEITIISEDSHWLLYDALNGKYLRPRTGVDNGLVLNDLKAYWDFSIESGLPLLVCTGSEDGVTFDRNILRFNPNGTNPPLFACYATGQNDYYLYKAGEPNPMITVTPSALDFEQIKVGNVSEPLSINIAGYNLTGNITYNVTGDNAEFNIATNDWDPATGGALHITFEPSAEQEFNATLTFSSAGAENKIVTLTGTGVSLLLPVADFIADKTAIFIEESVQFTDLSTGSPTSWEWTFTGGTPATSTLQNPIVEYNTVGVFDVSLTVTNEDGNHTETKIGYINVVVQPEKTYVLVTSFEEIEDGGQYLFVSAKNDIDYALGWQKASNRHGVPVVVEGNTITTFPAVIVTPSQDEIHPYEITIISEDDNWLLYDALNGKYLRPRTGTDNGLVLNDLKAYWDFSIESGLPSLVCTGSEDDITFDRNILRFNPNGANPPLFACYASGQNDYYLYKAGEPNPMIMVSPTLLDFEEVYIDFISEPLTINVAGYNLTDNINYILSGDDVEAFEITETEWDAAVGGILSVIFAPTEEKIYEATIVISSVGADNKTVTLVGSGAPVGIDKISQAHGIDVHPNPFVDVVYFSNIQIIERVTVTNVLGQKIMDFKPVHNKIDMSNLSKGIYLVSFQSKDGMIEVKKVVKQ